MDLQWKLYDIEIIGMIDSNIYFKNKKKTNPRKVRHYEIEMFTENGGIAYINDIAHKIKKNSLLIAKPGEIRSTVPPLNCYFIHLQPCEVLDKYLSDKPSVIQLKNPQLYVNLFKGLLYDRTAIDTENRLLLTHAKVFELLHYIQGDASVNINDLRNEKKSYKKLINKSICYIEDNYQSDISLEAISEHFNFSPTYFHKIFSEATGKTPHEYLTETRIRAAKKLLITTDMSIVDISAACGFSSQSHFGHCFKKISGQTPLQFRAQRYGTQFYQK